jgi:hypothetical protein
MEEKVGSKSSLSQNLFNFMFHYPEKAISFIEWNVIYVQTTQLDKQVLQEIIEFILMCWHNR